MVVNLLLALLVAPLGLGVPQRGRVGLQHCDVLVFPENSCCVLSLNSWGEHDGLGRSTIRASSSAFQQVAETTLAVGTF